MVDTKVKLSDLNTRLDKLQRYIDKTLHVTSELFEHYKKFSARPYYPLNDGWALTRLDSGQPFFVNTEDRNITPWIIMAGHWEPNVEQVLLSYASPGMTVLDIGAHFGYYTVKLGSKIGEHGRLHAFEPNPEVNAVCLENIKINGLYSHTTLHKFALGDANTTAILTHSQSNMASANLVGEQDADYSVSVEVRRIDDVVPSDRAIDLIKLDAEGYEKRILDGAISTLSRSPQCATMIELGLERWERFAPLNELINACGGNREIYAVQRDGTIRKLPTDKLRDFLLTCSFHENYFFVARPQDVETRIGHLVCS